MHTYENVTMDFVGSLLALSRFVMSVPSEFFLYLRVLAHFSRR